MLHGLDELREAITFGDDNQAIAMSDELDEMRRLRVGATCLSRGYKTSWEWARPRR